MKHPRMTPISLRSRLLRTLAPWGAAATLVLATLTACASSSRSPEDAETPVNAENVRTVETEGTGSERRYMLEAFDRLALSHAFDVEVRSGDPGLTITGPDGSSLARVEVEQRGSRVSIGMKDGRSLRNGRLRAVITTDELRSLELSGATQLRSLVALTGDATIRTSGASEIEVPVRAESLELRTSGASEIHLEGSCKTADIHTSGASKLDLRGLQSESLAVQTSGASELVVAAKTLSVSASGASRIEATAAERIEPVSLSGVATLVHPARASLGQVQVSGHARLSPR